VIDRKRTRWLLSLMICVLAASCAEPAGSGEDTARSDAIGDPSPAASSATDALEPSHEPIRVFVPPTRQEGDRVVLPVVFPDGSRAELAYPPELDLAGLGVRPYWAGCGRDFWFHYYDPYGSLYEGEPLAQWTGSDAQTVALWRSADKEPGTDGEPIVYLVFHFGSWTVLVYDYGGAAAMTDADRAACAMGLAGSVTPEGWIVMSGPPGVHLGGDEPELEFGGLGANEPFVLFFPGSCDPEAYGSQVTVIDGVPVDLSEGFASWCHPGEMMTIHVYFTGEPVFVERLVKELEVRDVQLSSAVR